ncbi:MAG: ADP-ribosylglycohydrolase family protein [Verrucomicrobiota bacterium]|jgi:ADP-ribosylglycohydrolase
MVITEPNVELQERFAGLLFGTAVGDALGLPAENLSADQIRRRWKGQWKMRFIFGRGMISDDTEHTLMVAQALLSHPEDAMAFQRTLAWKFRWWFAGLPGGVGLATARACLKLWIGFPPGKSGVHSAGSGPPMRSAILGAYFADEPQRRREFVLASSRLTHQGWKAETAALAVAESVALTMLNHGQPGSSTVISVLRQLSPEAEWVRLLTTIEVSLKAQHSVSEFARGLGLRKAVSGYSLHVVPVALYAWLRHPGDFRTALISVLECGGDTDTTGAILGALSGVRGGKSSIPAEWLKALCEWPRSRSVVERIAARLADQKMSTQARGPVHFLWPGLILRNLLFFGVVLIHGFRRLFPPY